MIFTHVFGQFQKATTEKGETVMLNSDGTWKYTKDCSNFITTVVTDKIFPKTISFSKEITVTNKFSDFKFSFYLDTGKQLSLTIKVDDSFYKSWLPSDSTRIVILFKDKSILDRHIRVKDYKTICYNFQSNHSVDPLSIELKAKEISIIRIYSKYTPYYSKEPESIGIEVEFNYEQAESLKNTLNCMLKL